MCLGSKRSPPGIYCSNFYVCVVCNSLTCESFHISYANNICFLRWIRSWMEYEYPISFKSCLWHGTAVSHLRKVWQCERYCKSYRCQTAWEMSVLVTSSVNAKVTVSFHVNRRLIRYVIYFYMQMLHLRASYVIINSPLHLQRIYKIGRLRINRSK